jgi:pimeloyl-ACP methyl ester carboxylesterase
MHRIAKRQFRFDGKTFYYWVVGKVTSPPLLMIPGLTGTHENLLELSYSLRKNFFLIMPDLPGWGMSPRPHEALTIEYYAHFFHELRRRLKINRLHIFGHCMGAAIAVEFTLMNPVSVNRLILVSAPYEEGSRGYEILKNMSKWGEMVPRSFRPLFYMWRNKYINFITGFYILKFKSFRRKLRMLTDIFKEQSKLDNQSFVESWLSLLDFDFSKLGKISKKVTVHLIFGGQDVLIPKQQAVKLHNYIARRSTLDLIPQAGHLPPLETPGILGALVLRYLRE